MLSLIVLWVFFIINGLYFYCHQDQNDKDQSNLVVRFFDSFESQNCAPVEKKVFSFSRTYLITQLVNHDATLANDCTSPFGGYQQSMKDSTLAS